MAAGANPVQITRGIDKTVIALVMELKKLSKEVSDEAAYCSFFSFLIAIVFALIGFSSVVCAGFPLMWLVFDWVFLYYRLKTVNWLMWPP